MPIKIFGLILTARAKIPSSAQIVFNVSFLVTIWRIYRLVEGEVAPFGLASLRKKKYTHRTFQTLFELYFFES